MDRILVTGGGGFIGSHMARHLYSKGHFVRVADIKFDDYIQRKYCSEKLNLDLRILENCLKATEGIDKVYNFAASMKQPVLLDCWRIFDRFEFGQKIDYLAVGLSTGGQLW